MRYLMGVVGTIACAAFYAMLGTMMVTYPGGPVAYLYAVICVCAAIITIGLLWKTVLTW